MQGQTECYDCNPKEIPKSFPVCTIRSTPSQPIHCIVWAKSYLFNQLFGIDEEEVPELDNSTDESNGIHQHGRLLIVVEEIQNLKKEAQALREIKLAIGTPEFFNLVFEKVFNTDIKRLLSMSDMWKTKTPPTPLDYTEYDIPDDTLCADLANQDQPIWDVATNVAVFKYR